MTGFKPKRFDVAGQHPDEVFGAVSDLVRVVDEVGKQTGVENVVRLWRQNRPMRHGDNLDADVQQYMAQGVRFIDGFKDKLPLGLSRSQQQVRDRCNELAGSMEKVLQKRLLESPEAKAWNYVKIKATPATVKQPGQTAVTVDKTVATVKDLLRGHFDSAWKAGMAQRSYWGWAKTAEVEIEMTGMYPPMTEGAKSWHAFMTRADALREWSARQGKHWAQVDLNEGIDFAPVMNFRATYRTRQKPRMRM
jgi:hypothetical protein